MSGKTGRASKSGLGGKRKSFGGKPKGSFKKNFKRQKVLTKDEKKELAKERKAAKPHAALVKEANKIFDEPIKALQKGQQQERIQVILDSCQGKLVVLAAKRDTSRVLQRAIKYGSKPQRSQLAAEFKGRLAHLAGERYGHFVVTKLLEYGNEEIKECVRQELGGKIKKLLMNKDSAQVVDYMYATSKAPQKETILQELYGGEFAVFRHTSISLEKVHETQPDKLEAILESIFDVCVKASDKQMLQFRPFHGLLERYFKYSSDDKREAMAGLLNKSALALHHSKEGVQVAADILSYGSAKDRKNFIRSIKGRAVDMATNSYAYLMVIKALDVTDDTKLLGDVIIKEVLAGLDELLESSEGCKVVLHLLSPKKKGYFTEAEVLFLETKLKRGQATTKKDASVRHKELVNKLLQGLLQKCKRDVATVIRSKDKSKVMYEAVLRAMSEEGATKFAEAGAELVDSVVQLAKQANIEKNIMQDQFGHWCVKRMLIFLEDGAFGISLANVLLQTSVGSGKEKALGLEAFAQTNRGAFVICTLVERLSSLAGVAKGKGKGKEGSTGATNVAEMEYPAPSAEQKKEAAALLKQLKACLAPLKKKIKDKAAKGGQLLISSLKLK